MLVFMVCGHLSGREYVHYICKEQINADRLAVILREKRPDILPVVVVQEDIGQTRINRTTFADNSPGPK